MWLAAPLNAEVDGVAGVTGLEGAAVPTGATTGAVLLAKMGAATEVWTTGATEVTSGAADETTTAGATDLTGATEETETTGTAWLTTGTLVAATTGVTGLVRVQGQLVMVKRVASVTV